MANIFIWHSSSSKESAEALRDAMIGLTTPHVITSGTLPEKDFSGFCITYGGTYTESFKWDRRQMAAILNDPRKIKKGEDKAKFEAGLKEMSLVSISSKVMKSPPTNQNQFPVLVYSLTENVEGTATNLAQYNDLVNKWGANNVITISAATVGATASIVKNKFRLFYFNGQLIMAHENNNKKIDAQVLKDNAKNYIKEKVSRYGVATENTVVDIFDELFNKANMTEEQLEAISPKLKKQPIIEVLGKDFTLLAAKINKAAPQIAKLAPKSEFFAIDVVIWPNNEVIVMGSPIYAPNIRVGNTAVSLATKMVAWVKDNSISAKETLKKLAEQVEDEETAKKVVSAISNILG